MEIKRVWLSKKGGHMNFFFMDLYKAVCYDGEKKIRILQRGDYLWHGYTDNK